MTTAKSTISSGITGEQCEKYVASSEFSTDKRSNPDLYKECCEIQNYCPFWKEAWFIWTTVGVSCFIAVTCIFCIAWCCCCRDSRSRGRGDVEMEEDQKEETEEEKKNGKND
ncbi:hypothetical protein CAEBREN_25859 [Caenorhabditis brenneri]|uniref:Uncharacterized protein n=1 Tax=Caenorhabditis brenneri TaxID=135651 RepID=G0MDM4_CAEBE|nr:hypothetical protein CAEBREN_25859 [Caenorhabditis brenneri]